jgi:hypothetical protein
LFASAAYKVNGKIFTSKRADGSVWHPTVEAAFAALQRDIDGATYKFGDFTLSRCDGDQNVYEYTNRSLSIFLHVDYDDMNGHNFVVRGNIDLGVDSISFSSDWRPTLEEAYATVRRQIATAKVVLASVETLIK